MRHARQKTWNEVRAIIRRRQREILIIRPEGDPERPWSFPGGNLHPHEPPVAGLRRICRNSIGQDVNIIGACIRASYGFAFHTVDSRYYLCELADSSALDDERPDARWILLAQLREYFFSPPTQLVVDRILETLHRA